MVEKSKPSRALDGIKILAFEQVLSGPFATCLLADMGAEVIKVERPGVGDVIRSWDSVVKGLSSGYVWLNRNKRSLTVDVKKAKGREILQELAKRSDIFFENYAPGVAARLGLGYEKLNELNPRLIYCSLSGYGQDGPYRDVKAYDLLIQGEGGIIATTGYPDKPARAGIAIADIASGMYAAIGILLALYQREKTGEGPAHRRLDARFDRLVARLFSASLLARRRRAGARRHAPSLRHALRSISWRATENT